MDALALGKSRESRFSSAQLGRAVVGLFAGTLFLSALLLFSVQPMFAKMVLPRLGGSPSVWAVSMCFFQAMLLAGYCYAHALNRFLPSRLAPLLHLALLAVAAFALPIGLRADWSEPPAGGAYLWLIGALVFGVGLPFFAVSANAPLLQSWFARSGHPHARDPYFLYGASNLGSLVALLAYPFLLEPFLGLSMQARLWTAGFLLLASAVGLCGFLMARHEATGNDTSAMTAPPSTIARPHGWQDRLAWIGLAAVPSGLLVAFTSFVTTDIASAPFLWVLPLALYLLTFILAFKEKPLRGHPWSLVHPVIVGIVLYGLTLPGEQGWVLVSLMGTTAFFITTLVAHRQLYERRPAPEHLTEFYLLMSLGGVVGGIFAALAAPQLFNVIWEFPLLLVAGMACRPGLFSGGVEKAELRRLAMIAGCGLIGVLAVLSAINAGFFPVSWATRAAVFGIFGTAALLSARNPLRQLVLIAMMGVTLAILPSAINRGNAERSFFGVHRVTLTIDRQMRMLMHGTTIHGAERLVDAQAAAVGEAKPATYYYPGGPMARGVDAARVASGKLAQGLRVGVVGLGAGSMACHSREGEAWRFYEIDPVVARIARDPSRFTFLSRCRPNADIVLGDARLTLAKEPTAGFDYLVIDAFSSDSVPVHLLTVAALQLYLDKLAANGILALHVSNRHLDLVDVVAAVSKAIPGLQVMLGDDRISEPGFDSAASSVVFITRSKSAMQPLRVLPYVVAMPPARSAAWTDDYSDILGAILRKYRN